MKPDKIFISTTVLSALAFIFLLLSTFAMFNLKILFIALAIVCILTTIILSYLQYYTASNAQRQIRLIKQSQLEKERETESQHINVSLELLKTNIESEAQKNNPKTLLSKLCNELNIVQAITYVKVITEEGTLAKYNQSFAATIESDDLSFKANEGLIGTAIAETTKRIYSGTEELKSNEHLAVSGLGNSNIKYLYVISILENNKIIGAAEFGFFEKPSEDLQNLISTYVNKIII